MTREQLAQQTIPSTSIPVTSTGELSPVSKRIQNLIAKRKALHLALEKSAVAANLQEYDDPETGHWWCKWNAGPNVLILLGACLMCIGSIVTLGGAYGKFVSLESQRSTIAIGLSIICSGVIFCTLRVVFCKLRIIACCRRLKYWNINRTRVFPLDAHATLPAYTEGSNGKTIHVKPAECCHTISADTSIENGIPTNFRHQGLFHFNENIHSHHKHLLREKKMHVATIHTSLSDINEVEGEDDAQKIVYAT